MAQGFEAVYPPQSAISGYDGTTFYFANVDSEGSLKVRNLVWNPATLAWEAVMASPDPTAKYKISDQDGSSYFGFIATDGSWYIMQSISGAYRYVKGSSGYTTNWANRASLSYDYFSNVF